MGLLRKSPDADVKELVTGVLWNLSSCEVCAKPTSLGGLKVRAIILMFYNNSAVASFTFQDLKRAIIDDGLAMVVTHIIIPHSGWDPNAPGDTCWSTVFRNASGVLRFVFSV